jgi:hypothetical protein
MPAEIATLIRVAPANVASQAIAASHLMEQIAKSPWRSGRRKQALFTHVARELAASQGVQLPKP